MKTENNFTLTKDEHYVIMREGKALDPKEPVKLIISGVLDSPLRWIQKRVNETSFGITPLLGDEDTSAKETLMVDRGLHSQHHSNVPLQHCHILVDREAMTIQLVISENDHYQTNVKGSLEFHPAFKRFGINSGEYLTPFEMADLIKMNRTFFENQDVAMNLVHTLKNFKAKIDKQIEAADDNRGNKKVLLEQAVDSNLPASFNMLLPIFKGQSKEKIEVEVYIRASDLTCTLISPEANDITERLRDEAISKVLKDIEEIAKQIVIIEK
jgi:hypothetical protein